MAPSFNNLGEADLDDDDFVEDEVDISDLRARYEVQLEQGFDAFVVVDELPAVNEGQKVKLVKFLLKKLNTCGKVKGDLHMPMGEDGKTLRFAFAEYYSPADAAVAVKKLDRSPLDKTYTLRVNKLTDIDRYGKEGKVDEKFTPPHIDEFTEKEQQRWWLRDPAGRGRDQFVMYRGDHVGVFWNNSREPPENIVDRHMWTESFVQWSPFGTYLTSVHPRGVQLWGCQSWSRLRRFAHPFVNLVAYSPTEKYLVTWSARPIDLPDDPQTLLSVDDEGKNYIIWELETGRPLRSFANLDLPGGTGVDEVTGGKQQQTQQQQQQQPLQQQQPQQRKYPWPAFKWSADDSYVARFTQGTSISVYELPKMSLLDKTAIKIEGVMDFEWAPATPQRDSIKVYEQLICFWTPEIGSNPARVGLMTIPSKQIIRTLNLFSVIDAKLHWQSEASYLCVKVDRHSKSKKFMATTLEIFRVREKGVPVEVVDTIKDTVINFAWEPRGDRFVIITTMEAPSVTAVPPKTSVSFFCPEKSKGTTVGNFRMLRTLEKKNSNAIYWSPRGRFVVVVAIQSPQSSDLDFYDVDFDGEKPESDKDLTANLQLMNTGDHYGVTDVEWDPSGRYVATWASQWKHAVENGYHLYDFKGELLREEHVEKFKQWQWRPRPASLLSRDEQKLIRKNLRQYSLAFDQEDSDMFQSADLAVVQARRHTLEAWHAWRAATEGEVAEERALLGLPPDPIAALLDAHAVTDPDNSAQSNVIEEIVEEVLEETEEVVL